MSHNIENTNTVSLRARGRGDIDARVKREILERSMLAALESAGDFFAGPGVAERVVALAAGIRRPRGVDDLREADMALQEFAERLIHVWRIWKEADRAVREVECDFGIGC